MNILSNLRCHATCCKEFTTKLDGKVDNVAWKEALRWLQRVEAVRSNQDPMAAILPFLYGPSEIWQ